ncbi:alpha/beta hydrolase [Kibdelosporangium aridum]|uniref:TAP-like protein n=1 Tax=Kibdelosporangium aridum TaxID=2030 RepID=A0A1Y5XY67_KIBAR|nr:alpha/beta hydrolase [Kibdelosporangium aridum]SMD20833.1 TAP-like protein [Kibdelosporangium aridum]
MGKRWMTAALAGVIGSTMLVSPAAASLHPCAAATEFCEGTVEVPLNWADPQSEKITIPFTFRPHSDRGRPSAGVIVGLAGGPAAGMKQPKDMEKTVQPLLTTYGMLAVQRRGFGVAGGLHCDDVDVYEPGTITACAERLGPRIQYFTTDQRVADVNAVRAALGVPKLVLYGISYGSLDGPAFAARYPQHVQAAIFDSPTLSFDPRTGYASGFVNQEAMNSITGALDHACAQSRACRELPGDAGSRMAKVAQMLRTNPDPAIPMRKLLGTGTVYDPMTAREANAAFVAYANGDRAPLHRLARLVDYLDGDPNDLLRTAGMGFLSFLCNDIGWPYARNATPAQRVAQLAAYYERNPEYPLTSAEIDGEAGFVTEWCAYWPTPRAAPPVPPNAKFPDIPVLTIAGTFDWGAAENAETLAAMFRDGRSLVVPFAGHATSVSFDTTYETCVSTAVRNFIIGQRRLPSCSGENFVALGRFPLTSEALLTTTFHTAMDALASRIPNSYTVNTRPEMPGLRGGKVTFDGPKATLHDVRYTTDTVVSGEIRFTGTQAEADLTANGKRVQLTWKPFEAKENMWVTGAVDGKRFARWLPVT